MVIEYGIQISVRQITTVSIWICSLFAQLTVTPIDSNSQLQNRQTKFLLQTAWEEKKRSEEEWNNDDCDNNKYMLLTI